MKHDIHFGDLVSRIIQASKNIQKTVAFSDGADLRTVQALDYYKRINQSRFLLVGDQKTIYSHVKETGLSMDDRFEIIDPRHSNKKDHYKQTIKESFEAKNKPVSDEQLEDMVLDTSYYVSTMLKNDHADCAVGGSLSSTRALVKSVIHVLGLSEGRKYLSAAAFVDIPHCSYGHHGQFCLADPAIIPRPDQAQLFDITVSSYETAKIVLGVEPKVALLSYSTLGSAKSQDVDIIKNVVKRVRDENPEMIIDGELQLDAAIVPEVAQQKCPSSPLKGEANVLIMPNLDAANISYKVMQRLAKATVCGSIILGAGKPFNDLSRGCPYQDIISLTAMTILQANGM